MKLLYKFYLVLAVATLIFPAGLMAKSTSVAADNIQISLANGLLNVNADILLDSLNLGSNKQVMVTAIARQADAPDSTQNEIILPSILINGRNMHYSYERGVLNGKKEIKSHDIIQEVQRHNGTKQSVAYSAQVAEEEWMTQPGVQVSFVIDECGCGVAYAQNIADEATLIAFQNPVKEMKSVMIIPEIELMPEQIHEGRARVQFEVDRTVLHVDPYRCANGQRIDNRGQIKMIDDSVKYALTDPNVELSAIEICGYASPESPYLHNWELADGRSKALAEYLADRYSLPKGSVTYSCVPENWVEFREMVVKSPELTEQQRTQLLELIDEPASTPEQWDRKERLLKTDPKFASLYKSKILPEWFPKLRATTFAIHTRLKDLTDEQLKEVIKTTPEKMSLNQMYRVALMYPADSDEFNDVMLLALKYYPEDMVAITNAATAAVARGEYDRAKQLLEKAPEQTPAVNNLRGIIATSEEKYEEAAEYFKKAGNMPDAQKNLEMLK